MSNIHSNKKELSPEQREELLRALKARFEKNMNRHKGLEWAKVQAKLEANTIKLLSLNEIVLGVHRMSWVTIKRRANTFFMIVQRKAPKDGEVFVTTMKRWSQGKNINRKTALLRWQPSWELNF